MNPEILTPHPPERTAHAHFGELTPVAEPEMTPVEAREAGRGAFRRFFQRFATLQQDTLEADQEAFRAGSLASLEQVGIDFDAPPLVTDTRGIDDIVHVDSHGRARRGGRHGGLNEHTELLSNHEVGLVQENQELIRRGIADREHAEKFGEGSRIQVTRLPRDQAERLYRTSQAEEDQQYLAKFRKKHITPKTTRVGHIRPWTPTPEKLLATAGRNARTSLQEQSETRANLRTDVIRQRRHEIEDYQRLYGEIILPHNSDRLEALFEEGRFTGSQKRAMRKAARKVRRAFQTINNSEARLQRSALGIDIPGRAVTGRRAATQAFEDVVVDPADTIREDIVDSLRPVDGNPY